MDRREICFGRAGLDLSGFRLYGMKAAVLEVDILGQCVCITLCVLSVADRRPCLAPGAVALGSANPYLRSCDVRLWSRRSPSRILVAGHECEGSQKPTAFAYIETSKLNEVILCRRHWKLPVKRQR